MSKRRKFSEEFKREAIELTRQPGVKISQVVNPLPILTLFPLPILTPSLMLCGA
jgi:Transposase